MSQKAPSHTIWTAAEAAKATGGQSSGEWFATGISIDTRTLQEGDLFIALHGDHSDGHAHAAAALEKGACAVMIDHRPEGLGVDAPVLMVEDTFKALQDLGRASRARSAARVIAVTGSVGKTGTKEMLARAFGSYSQTHAAQKSYNNHWGVPFTLSSMHAGCDTGIFEIGMNHEGEIAPLTKMVQPDIAIITTVAPVHIEHFDGKIEGIADEKAHIFDGLTEGGIALINRDMEMYERVADYARKLGAIVMSFGKHPDSDYALIDCLVAANGTRVTANVRGKKVNYTLAYSGEHIAVNSLAVVAALDICGAPMDKALKALSSMEAPAGRGARESLDIGDPDNPVTLIDESYNASPTAMKAAFKVLALIDPGRGGRRIAVLGDMLELGKDGPKAHADLALPLKAANIDLVYTCGPLMKNLADKVDPSQKGAHKDNSQELAEIVPDALVPGDVVMVKGSLGSKMSVVVEALRALPAKKGGAKTKRGKGQ